MAQQDERQRRSKYLDPEILNKIAPLEIVARQVVEGVRIGMHKSPLRGISTEFTAHRAYVPGDEARHIDWKVYARARRYFVKLFEAETNFTANLLLDASSSMHFGSGKITKLEYAKYMAASIAYMIVQQRDSVGVGIFDGELRKYIEPKSTLGILGEISGEMEKVRPLPKTNISALLHDFARRMSRRGFVILFSDLFDKTDEFIKGLSHLRFRGHNVIVFHILDEYELEFPLKGMWKFVGLENDGEIITQPNRVRSAYLAELTKFVNETKRACMRNQVDYVLVNTAQPIELVISNYLLQRIAASKAT